MAEFYRHASGEVYFRMEHFHKEHVTDRPATDLDKERHPGAWQAFREPAAPEAAEAEAPVAGPVATVEAPPLPAAPARRPRKG